MVTGMLYKTDPVVASEPRKDYWFTETITIGDIYLPTGVVVRASDTENKLCGNLSLKNQTETLLFVLSLGYKDVLVMTTPDPNWKNRVNGAHEVASYLVAPDRPAYLSMEALAELDRDLEDKNVLSSAPPPEDVAIPAAQSSELLLVYDGQVILVPFTVSYEINSGFDNGKQADHPQTATNDAVTAPTQPTGTAPEAGARNQALFIGFLGMAGMLMIGWMVWRGVLRSKI
jgi:hypothetical protein